MIWTTRTGEHKTIAQLTTNHLINCIKLLQSRRKWRQKFLRPMQEELQCRFYRLLIDIRRERKNEMFRQAYS